jgi:putative DNA primase/helicase
MMPEMVITELEKIEDFKHRAARRKAAAEQEAIPTLESSEGRTEAANARRLIARYGSHIRYVTTWQKFVACTGRCWKLDGPETEKFAKDSASELWNIFASMPKERSEQSQLNQIISFIRGSNSAAGIRNALFLARSESGIPVDFSQLDRQPMLFNCANGTIDLESGKLRAHNPEDYLTKISGVVFDPTAKCPTWEKFLIEIFDGDCDLIDFVWIAAGYSLTGLIREHVLFFNYGTGRNGKSTLIDAMQHVWGDYAATLSSDLLMVARGERHPTEMCDLYGIRLAVASETEEGRRMAEVGVKQMTGGDMLKGRRMREDYWQFRPSHKLWLSGNHRPKILGTDNAIWDRVSLIPFTQRFAPDDPRTDPSLPEKLRAESSGILNWAIKGCLEWQRRGLQKPAIVRTATEEYRKQEDVIGEFLSDLCVIGDGFQAGASDLHRAFEIWGGSLSQTSFGSALRERGFASDRATSGPNRGRKIWFGIGLLKDSDA